MKILVLGIGNPILTDDAVGILVAREITGVEVKEAPVGGLLLLDCMRGYDKVIVVDAVKTGQKPGTVSVLTPKEIKRALHASSTHDVSFFEAVQLGKELFPEEMPSDIVVVGIEVQDVETFSETPTPLVLQAVPKAVNLVLHLVETMKQHQK